MKKTLAVLCIFVLLTTLFTLCLPSCKNKYGEREYRSGAYRYTVENKEVTIVKYSGKDTDVTVPECIWGMPVVAIGSDAFRNCANIKSLKIPNSVVKIDNGAFSECPTLEHVTLGRGIREIDYSPFYNCDKMLYNEYQNGYYVGNDENPYVALVTVTSEDIDSITIHPDTVVICGSAMESCRFLRELVIPDGVVSIGGFALQYCDSLETIHIPKNVESIGIYTFGHCDSIREIAVSDENTYYKSVDGSLFSRDGSLLIKYAAGQEVSTYRVPDGTVIIENDAFEEAKHLTDVVLPDSVEEIGSGSFRYCENMRSIHLGNGLKRIEGQAFGFCKSLTEITIPDGVEELPHSAFSYCDKLESAMIGSGVVRMGTEAFLSCDALSEVVFRDPIGWEVQGKYSFHSSKVALSDPKKNAEFLTGEYCNYYWKKN